MVNPMGRTTTATLVLASLIGAILMANLLRPFGDHDFFWHLKTGEWIWQNRTLPSEDPFAYTTPPHLTGMPRFILTQYWISQLVYYLFHRAGGFPALVALRFIIAALLLWVLFRQRKGDRLIFMSLTALAAVVLGLYPLERPQVFSFICFSALFGLLSALRGAGAAGEGGTVPWFAVPLLMAVWANLHGGFLMGQALILAFLALEGLKFLHPALHPPSREGYRRLVVAGVLGLAASLCNPNTWHGLAFLAAPAPPGMVFNLEFQSTAYWVRRLHEYRLIVYWLLLLAAVLGFVARRRKTDITTVATLAALGLLSFVQIRYVPFFLVVAVPCTAGSLSVGGARKWFVAGFAGLALGIGLFFFFREWPRTVGARSGNWVSASMPSEQADFILANDLKGNMYNHWVWGGYLIWRLAPGRKVFLDGRGLDAGALEMAANIDNATVYRGSRTPIWRSIFDTYGISYVVAPSRTFDGEPLPLVDALLKDPAWLPYSSGSSAAIFIRDTAQNREVIERHGLRARKRELLGDRLALLDRWISSDPRNVAPLVMKGDFLMEGARWLEARRAYEEALKIDPANAHARERLGQIAAMTGP